MPTAIELDSWTCRIALTSDPHGPGVSGCGTTRERAEREAERQLRGRRGYERFFTPCSGSRGGAL